MQWPIEADGSDTSNTLEFPSTLATSVFLNTSRTNTVFQIAVILTATLTVDSRVLLMLTLLILQQVNSMTPIPSEAGHCIITA